tara:strand:+ start:24603 stop:24815 length:213 start_codon:yes stop_codon:yes gene_type:complete
MTPQEKAKELVGKYSTYVVMWAGGIETSKQNVKQCALIAVDEILKVASFYNDSQSEVIYWQEVKEEIEKL